MKANYTLMNLKAIVVDKYKLFSKFAARFLFYFNIILFN